MADLCTGAIERDLFMLEFTRVSLIRGPVLKLRMNHCSTGKVNGLGEITDPQNGRRALSASLARFITELGE